MTSTHLAQEQSCSLLCICSVLLCPRKQKKLDIIESLVEEQEVSLEGTQSVDLVPQALELKTGSLQQLKGKRVPMSLDPQADVSLDLASLAPVADRLQQNVAKPTPAAECPDQSSKGGPIN